MTFPTTSILDDFNRANEGPPPSASWTTPPAVTGLKVDSNQLRTTALFGWGNWIAATYGPDCEAYITLAERNGGARFELFLRSDNANILASSHSYNLTVSWTGSVWSAQLYDWNYDPLGTAHDLSIGDGDSVGLSAIGSTLEVWEKVSGVWSSAFSLVDSYTTGAGYFAVQMDNLVKLDDFGGGAAVTGVAPTAAFSAVPTSGMVSLSVTFTDESTDAPTSWLWDFGDSTTSTDQNPTHVYTAMGTYTVALTATNASGDDTETKTNYISVFGVDFSATPTSGAAPLSVDFTDETTGSPTQWLWNFGDGGNSTDQNPTHVYSAIGTYTVTLVVSQ